MRNPPGEAGGSHSGVVGGSSVCSSPELSQLRSCLQAFFDHWQSTPVVRPLPFGVFPIPRKEAHMPKITPISVPWPVWRDSTTAPVRFCPLSKKEAVKLFHQARQFERQTRLPGKQDGALGRNGLAVLHALIFDCLNYQTGRLDPSQKTIA